MSEVFPTKACAKINLFLKIAGSLPGGYHRLYMLMQEISLGDDVTVTLDDSKPFAIELESDTGVPVEKDLSYKAADLFYSRLSRKNIVPVYTSIEVSKHTPSQAGLGGGSSDAAAVLNILQKFYGEPFEKEELLRMAFELGADVPFFVEGGSAICEGAGEYITPLPSLKGLHLILVKPEEGVPTGKCFAMSDASRKEFNEDEFRALAEGVFMTEGEPVDKIKKAKNFMVNDLENPAKDIVPLIGELLDSLGETNPLYKAMSGSGSCIFGIYESEQARLKAFEKLKSQPLFSGCQIIPAVTV